MIVVISPAKTLDFETAPITDIHTQSDFLKESTQLIKELRKLNPSKLSELMKISDNLGTLNYGRFQDWQLPFNPSNAKQAVLAFKGDVYTGLNADTLSEDDLSYAQQHLRILSGLYGLLRPLDLIQPYRLEMGTPFVNKKGKNLYEFWDMSITHAVNKTFADEGSATLINLASNEYFKCIKPKNLKATIITPVFKDLKGDQYKIISFFAKKARGLMTRYIIENRLENPADIKHFDVDGYRFTPSMSSESEWVFIRDHA
jgi:cytoplasmic iron level regulating protein YaaA (DUF328/UPF0246 family)